VDIGECVERGWKTVIDNFGIVAGASVLMLIVFIVAGLVSMAISLVIPFANVLLPSFYTGPLLGGYLWFLLRLSRGEGAGVGDAFAGFGGRGVQLMLCSLIQGLANLACMIPMFAVAFVAGFSGAMRGGGPPANFDATWVIAMIFLGLVGLAGVVYVNIVWTHALLLIIDKGYNFWPAMQLSRRLVSKRWWMTFLFLFVGTIISGVGAVACLVGLLVSVPLYYAMRVCFYDDNFRDLAPVTTQS
jgi:hypothetical protein